MSLLSSWPAAVWLYFAGYLDRGKPGITLKEEISAIGRKKDIGLSLSDAASGLARIKVEIVQDNQARLMPPNPFPGRPAERPAGEHRHRCPQAEKRPAILSITAYDHSLFKNEAVWSSRSRSTRCRRKSPSQSGELPQPGRNRLHRVPDFQTGLSHRRVRGSALFQGPHPDARRRPTTVAYFAGLATPPAAKRDCRFCRDAAGNEAQTSLPFTIKPK